jgi:hypothetical protein
MPSAEGDCWSFGRGRPVGRLDRAWTENCVPQAKQVLTEPEPGGTSWPHWGQNIAHLAAASLGQMGAVAQQHAQLIF